MDVLESVQTSQQDLPLVFISQEANPPSRWDPPVPQEEELLEQLIP